MKTNEEQMRREFEEWSRSSERFYNLLRMSEAFGQAYFYMETQIAWDAWQAATEAAEKRKGV